MKNKGNIYFASDFHLGLKGNSDPRAREKHVVKWLDFVAPDAKAIYLVGDIFDFWWEYRKVVPKGFTRFLGKISEITDSGTEVHFFTGNHDMWIGDYLKNECGMELHSGGLTVVLNKLTFHIAHGEGLGVDKRSYRLLLWVFRNRFIRSLYSALHPSVGVSLAHKWSLHSRLAKNYSKPFLGPDKEALFRYAHSVLEKREIDIFVFGHRHIELDQPVGEKSRLFILGNWFNAPCYLEMSNDELKLISYPYH